MSADGNGSTTQFGETMRRRLEESVQALYRARIAGDVDDFLGYFTPDARLWVHGNPALNPGAGLRIGHAGIARLLADLHRMNHYVSHRIDDIVIDGDIVVVRWSAELIFRENGKGGEFEVIELMRLQDGLIAELHHYYDTGTMSLARGRITLA
jgi:ketosteroid isomerase-like protein